MRNIIWIALVISAAVQAQTIKLQCILPGYDKTVKQVAVRGNKPPLAWDKSYLLQATATQGVYETQLQVHLEPHEVLEYKYMVNEAEWELPGVNRLWFAGKPLAVADTFNQYTPDAMDALPLLPPALLQRDLEILRQATALHPGLFRHITPADTAALFGKARQVFSRACTLREAYLTISEICAGIRCGHTFASYFNQPGFIQQVLFGQADKLPFHFVWIQNRMIVTKPLLAAGTLQQGDEIVSVNGVAVGDILRTLLPYVKADGNNDAKRTDDLKLNDWDTYESFDVYFPLLYAPAGGQWQLEVVSAAGKQFTAAVPAVARSSRRSAAMQLWGTPDNPAGWQLRYLSDSVAHFSFPTFATFTMDFAWEMYLKKSFDAIRKRNIKHLLIDIRGNEGGDDAIPYMIAGAIATQALQLPEQYTTVAYDKLPASIAPYCFSWTDAYKDFSGKVTPLPDRGFRLNTQTDALQLPASKNAWKGKVYLLTDAANSSATFYMAQLMKANGRGLLLGTATGGDGRGINGGQIIFLRLPGTGIEADIPVYATHIRQGVPGGITPDVEVITTVADIQQGRDPVVEAALRIIRSGR